MKAINEVLKREGKNIGLPYGCDAWILHEAKIATTIFGPGDGAQTHKPDQFVQIEEIQDAAKIYALTILDLLNRFVVFHLAFVIANVMGKPLYFRR